MRLLDQLKERYIFEKAIFAERSFFLIDFYLPKPRKLCIEIDGSWHYGRESYDAARDEFITNKRKMKMLRITNAVANKLTAESLLRFIDRACGRTRQRRVNSRKENKS